MVSWRHGQIVFENERLEDAITEMNRYSRKQIVLSDSNLASLKISGAFNTGDTSTFVEALTAYFPIEHTSAESGTIVLKPLPPVRGKGPAGVSPLSWTRLASARYAAVANGSP
ncbi:FecR family protein [Lysobacter gummosus]|uniref:hypothetical protein n=1 Tax=Lysobacter gummosus TaxID=262324 RepID=UPI0036333BA8